MSRYRVEMVIATEADLVSIDIQPGDYLDPHYVDAMFTTAIARYEADKERRIVSFKIEPAPEAPH